MLLEDEKHLDVEALTELQDIMEDDFGTLLETYIEDVSEKLELLDEAMAQLDASALRELAHSLKGASCNIGALPLSRLCETVEQLAKNEQLGDLPPVLPGIRVEFTAVKSLLLRKI